MSNVDKIKTISRNIYNSKKKKKEKKNKQTKNYNAGIAVVQIGGKIIFTDFFLSMIKCRTANKN